MYEIFQHATPGSLTPSDPTPMLIPSFAGVGGASATQNDYTVTVTTVLPHNIPTDPTDRISRFGVSVYLAFESSLMRTGVYTDIIVTEPTQFICTSTTHALAYLPVQIKSLASTQVSFSTMAITVPSNSLKVGSSIRTECFLHLPDSVARLSNDSSTSVGAFIGNTLELDPYKSQAFFSDSVIGSTDTSYYMHSTTVFLDTKANSDFFTSVYGGPGYQNTIRTNVNNTYGINLTDGFIVCPSISFSDAAVNDYVMCSMMRVEIAR